MQWSFERQAYGISSSERSHEGSNDIVPSKPIEESRTILPSSPPIFTPSPLSVSHRDDSSPSPTISGIRPIIFRKESIKPTPSESASLVNNMTYTSQGMCVLCVFLDEQIGALLLFSHSAEEMDRVLGMKFCCCVVPFPLFCFCIQRKRTLFVLGLKVTILIAVFRSSLSSQQRQECTRLTSCAM